MLHYPDLGLRAPAASREAGRQRDAVFADPTWRRLVEWAGRRRPADPIPAAAAVLTAAGRLLGFPEESRPDLDVAARQIAVTVDAARPVHVDLWRRWNLVECPDRLPAVEADPPTVENPSVSVAVSDLLRQAGFQPGPHLARRCEDAVVQAGEWWASHPSAQPDRTGDSVLPGITTAQDLKSNARLAAAVSDPELLSLVAGPRPGRGRSAQVAWCRGLTYWTAAWIASDGQARPPQQVVRWWRTQIEALIASPPGSASCEPSTIAS